MPGSLFDNYPDEPFASTLGQTYTTDEDLLRRVGMVQGLAKDLGPAEVLSLAQSPLADDELLQAVSRTSAYAQSSAQATFLAQLPLDHQAKRWEAMTRAQQENLRAAGYMPPGATEHHTADRSILGRVLRGAGAALDFATQPLQDAVDTGLKAVNAIGRQPSHLYRAVQYAADSMDGGGAQQAEPGTGFAGLPIAAPTIGLGVRAGNRASLERAAAADPRVMSVRKRTSNLLDAWGETGNGEATFAPTAIRKAFDALGSDDPELVQVLMRLASGDSLEEVTREYAAPGTAEYEQAYLSLAQTVDDGRAQKALTALGAGHLSPGRVLASMHATPGTRTYDLLSGAGDATFQWYTDPLLAAGKARKGYLLARYGIRGANETELYRAVDRQFNNPRVRRAAEEIAQAVKAGDEARLGQKLPRSQRLITTLIQTDAALKAKFGVGIETADDVRDFYKSTVGMTALAKGQWKGATSDVFRLPMLSRTGQAAARAKVAMEDTVNFITDAGMKLREPLAVPDMAVPGLTGLGAHTGFVDSLQKATLVTLSPITAFAEGFLTKIPRVGYLPLNNPDTPEILQQLLSFGIRGPQRREFINQFLHADIADKRVIARNALNVIFDRAGVFNNPETAKWADTFLHSLDNQRYAAGDLDLIIDGKRTGVLPRAHRADAIAIPDFRELIAQSRRLNATRFIFGAVNNRTVDAFMGSFWKPAVLLRLGFIPRAAGEEVLSFIVRYSPAKLAKAYAAAIGGRDGQTLAMLRPATWAAEHLAHFVPDSVQAAAPIDFMAHHLANRASGVVRRGARAWAGPELVDAMRDLGKHASVARAFSERVSGRQGIIGEVVDSATDGPAPLTMPTKIGGRVVELPMRPDGTFGLQAKGDPSYFLNYDLRVREHLRDPVGHRAVQAVNVHVPGVQAERIAHAFEDTALLSPAGEVGDGHAIVAEIRHQLALAPEGFQRAVRAYAYGGDEKALAKAVKAKAKVDPALGTLVDKLPTLTKRDRAALVHDLRPLLEDIDDSALYALNPGGWFHGSVYGLDGKLVEDAADVTPVGAVGPGYYFSEHGRYSATYADPALRPRAGGSVAQPTVWRFRWTGDKPMKLLRPEHAPDHVVQTVAKGMGRFFKGDELVGVRGHLITTADHGDHLWLYHANRRAFETFEREARIANPAADPDLIARRFNKAWTEAVIDPLRQLGYDGIADRSVQGAEEGVHRAIALFDPSAMEKVGTVNLAELRTMEAATQARLEERRNLIADALRDPDAAHRLTEEMARVRASAMDMADDVAAWEMAQKGVSQPIPTNMARIFMPALPAADAKAVLARLHEMPAWGSLGVTDPVPAGFLGAANQAGGQGYTAAQVARSRVFPDDLHARVALRRAEDIADAGLSPLGRWGSTDPDEARRMVDWFQQQLGDFTPKWGLTFVDVPIEDAMRMRAHPFVPGAPRTARDLQNAVEHVPAGVAPVSDLEDHVGAAITGTGGRPQFDQRIGTQVWVPEHLAGSSTPLDESLGVVPVADLDAGDRLALRAIADRPTYLVSSRPLEVRNDEELLAQAAAEWDATVTEEPRLADLPFLNDAARTERLDAVRQDLRDLVALPGADPDTVAAANGLLDVTDALYTRSDSFWAQLGARASAEGTTFADLAAAHGVPADGLRSVPGLLDRLADAHRATPLGADELASLPRWARAVVEDRALVRPGALSLAPGRTVDEALGDATKRSAQNAWDLFAGDDGTVLHELAGPVADRSYDYDTHLLGSEALDDLPSKVSGPRYQAYHERWDQRLIRWGFDDVIGTAISALIRQPLYLTNYARAKGYAEMIAPVLRDEELYSQALAALGRDEMVKVSHAFEGLDDTLRKRLAGVRTPGTVGEWATAEGVADAIPAELHGLKLEDFNMLSRWANNDRHVRATVRDIATERAIHDSIPFIDDHRLRSQFQEYARNFIPFWFAEEQFLARWARTFVHSPEALRKAQLYMNGLRATGRITTNDYGEEVFMVPGSEVLVDAMARAGSLVFGKDAYVPELKGAFGLQGQVSMTLPGLGSGMGRPQFGPLVGVGIGLLSRRFPELANADDSILGARGANRSIPEQLIPTSLMRAFRWLSAKPEEYAPMTIQAIQYLEANGLGPSPDATSDELETYLERVENHTRTLLAAQTIIGFASPSSPSVDVDGTELSGEFKDLLRNLPLDEAMGEFLARHPDATPYTVFGTKSASGAPLASTPESLAFMEAHPEVFQNYPLAAAWLLPQSQAKDNFERRAYYQQLAWGLRQRKAPIEVLRDIRFAKAADDYFALKDQVESALAANKNDPTAKRELKEWWRGEKAVYMKQHPVFAEELQRPDAHLRRMKVLAELPRALTDPRVPKEGSYGPLRTMVEGWYKHQAELQPLMDDQRAAATRQRKDLREGFALWAKAYADAHPEVKAFYQRVLEPEIGVDVEDING